MVTSKEWPELVSVSKEWMLSSCFLSASAAEKSRAEDANWSKNKLKLLCAIFILNMQSAIFLLVTADQQFTNLKMLYADSDLDNASSVCRLLLHLGRYLLQ